MTAKPASEVADQVAAYARSVSAYIDRIDALNSSGLRDHDVSRAYAGAYLQFHSYMEASLERLFMGLLMQRFELPSDPQGPLVAIRSEVVARRAVAGDRSYVDWLPYRRTRRRAQAFLSSGRPFSELERPHVSFLDKSQVLRNALAHTSNHSLRRFREEFIDGTPIPARESRPIPYMRGIFSGRATRMTALLREGVSAFSALCR